MGFLKPIAENKTFENILYVLEKSIYHFSIFVGHYAPLVGQIWPVSRHLNTPAIEFIKILTF